MYALSTRYVVVAIGTLAGKENDVFRVESDLTHAVEIAGVIHDCARILDKDIGFS